MSMTSPENRRRDTTERTHTMPHKLRIASPKSARRTVMDDARGLSTVEYVIILVLIAASAIGTWVTFGEKLVEKLESANTEFDQVTVGH
jgi:Flp pilus assembly pilin Flp